MKKPLIIVFLGFIFLILAVLLINILNTQQKTTQLAVKETLKDCGSNIDKEGATHTLNIQCFVEAFKTCTPAKIYEEQFPPDNVPSIKTTTLIEGKIDNRCRIQVNVRNVLAIPENNIYYCYNAGMGRVDDTQNFNHLVIDNCDNDKTSIY
jgi:uncharacterized secreted protein with C-terminal beta-propeller domain